jgi:RecJ-like exonuclease
MARLQEQLERIKESGKKRIPEAARAVMTRAQEELKQSGIAERTLRVGARAPEFSLPEADGKMVGSQDLLRNGPLVVSFYRGKW